MNKIFVVSDMHFGHKNIIAYEKRSFSAIEEMDEVIIKKWNNIVKKEDKVFVLGDVSFYNKEKTTNIVKRLNGYKYLIMGNHDRSRSVSWWREVGFNEVSEYPIIIKEFTILSHEPVYLNSSMPYINVHGHTHSNSMASNGVQQYFNACIDANNMQPMLLSGIINKIYTLEANNGSKNMSNDN